jgi:hypothetical protein
MAREAINPNRDKLVVPVDGSWMLSGNAGTDPPDQFLGTKDDEPLLIKTNGNEVARFTEEGRSGFGTGTPEGKVHVSSAAGFDEPQIKASQQKLGEFARIRLEPWGVVKVDTGQVGAFPAWDIAAGVIGLNVFFPPVGNVMTFRETGHVGIGTDTPGTTLDVAGTASVEVLQITGGADLAESFPTTNATPLEPGSVLVIDPERPGNLRLSDCAYDR